MRQRKHPFEGAWDVVALEYHTCGEWFREFELVHGEWRVDFLPDGIYVDIYHTENDAQSGRWTFDVLTGLISVGLDGALCGRVRRYVFQPTSCGPWLCFHDEAGRAHTRLKLVRPQKSDT